MNIRYVLATLFFLFVLCISCKQRINRDIETIMINTTPDNPISLSSISDNIEEVTLELTDESLLSDQIFRVLIMNDYIIVADRKQSTPLVFDRKGRFIRSIGKRGQGPEEFLSVADIAVNEKDNLLYITSTTKTVCHRLDGAFVSKSNLGSSYLNYIDNTLYLIKEKFEQDSINTRISMMYLTDKTLNIKDSIELKRVENAQMMYTHPHRDFVTIHDGKLNQYMFEFEAEPFIRDTLFRIEDNELIPDLKLDFGTSGLDANGERSLYVWNIYRSNRYAFAVYGFPPNIHMRSCYDLKEQKGYTMQNGYNDDIYQSGIVDIRPVNTNSELYYFLSYKHIDDTCEANPSLYIGTLKK